ncbi:hypothetical protein PV392_18055 [Streptomyces sp. ME03-5709C]|nr:hypothetical protein [Streptomyces sp. ME03-5709C]
MAVGAPCALGVYVGTVWVARPWQDRPLGHDAGNDLGPDRLMPVAWFCVLLLLSLGLVLRWRPLPGGGVTAWLASLVAVGALTLLYRAGMEWPILPPDRAYGRAPGLPVHGEDRPVPRRLTAARRGGGPRVSRATGADRPLA